MSKGLVKANNAFLFVAAVLLGGLSWATGTAGMEQLEHSPLLKKLCILLVVLFALSALICLVLSSQDMWQQLGADDDKAQQPTAPRALGKALQQAFGTLEDRYRIRKGVERLADLQRYVALSPRGAGLGDLLQSAGLTPLGVGGDKKSQHLPAGCAWWGSSLEKQAPAPQALLWAVELDQYGNYTSPADAAASSPNEEESAVLALEKQWLTLLSWLARRGGIQGILVVLSAEQLQADAEHETHIALRLRALVRTVMQTMGRMIPVSVVVNRCGQRVGFQEFFVDDERSGSALMGFELDDPNAAAQAQFERKFDQFLADCAERIGDRVRLATTLAATTAVLQFPTGLHGLKTGVSQLLRDLGHHDDSRPSIWQRLRANHLDAIWLRNLYLTDAAGARVLQPTLPDSVAAHVQARAESIPPSERDPRPPAWLGFMNDLTGHPAVLGQTTGQSLTRQAWLRGLTTRLALGMLLMLGGTMIFGLTYGAKRKLGQALLGAIKQLREPPSAPTRAALLQQHKVLHDELTRHQGQVLAPTDRQRLLQLGARDFESRYLLPASSFITDFVRHNWRSLSCATRSGEDPVWRLLQYGYVSSPPPGQAALDEPLLSQALKGYHARLGAPLESLRQGLLAKTASELQQRKNELQHRPLVEAFAELSKEAPLEVLDGSETFPPIRSIVQAAGYKTFLLQANGDCLQIQEYEELHASTWTHWLRRYAQTEIFAIPAGTGSPTADGYARWLVQLRPQAHDVPLGFPLGLGETAIDKQLRTHAKDPATPCQTLNATLAKTSLHNTQRVLTALKSKLPVALTRLKTEILVRSVDKGKSAEDSAAVERLYAPFKVLEPLAQNPTAPHLVAYMNKLDTLIAVLEGIERNHIVAAEAPVVQYRSWQRAAFDFLLRANEGGKTSELVTLQEARKALTQALLVSVPASARTASMSRSIAAVDDILRGAEVLVWEVMSRLAADYVRVRMAGARTLTERARANPTNKENLTKLTEFFAAFVEGELEPAMKPSAGTASFPDYMTYSHRLVFQSDTLRQIRNNAQQLLDQLQPQPAAVTPPTPPPATPVAPAAPPVAAAPPPSGPHPVRIKVAECANLVEHVTLVQAGAYYKCTVDRATGAGQCSPTPGKFGTDFIQVGTAERVRSPRALSLLLNLAAWTPERRCERTDAEHGKCFKLSFDALSDGLNQLCKLSIKVYLDQPIHPPAAPAAAAEKTEAATVAKLEIPAWDKNLGSQCWLRWDAPEVQSGQ